MIASLMPTYNRADLAFERGDGVWLYTVDGRRFLDFGAGIATSSLGHNHPHLVSAIAGQAGRVMHVSNLYRVPQAERLAARLVEATFADSVFFCNSGAEANEGMVKMMRRAQAATGHEERTRIICFDGAFHGRTLAMLSATGNAKYLSGFGEPAPGFDHVPLGNMNALRDAIGPTTAGIMLEPIQGESGVNASSVRFLQELRAAADEFGVLLGLDEVQCGMGRTGRLFAHQWADIRPDVVSAAKGIGGGFPLGAILATEAVAKHLTPGSHGTTFGGNPLACAAGNAVLDVLLEPGFLSEPGRPGHVERVGRVLFEALEQLVAERPDVFERVRGHETNNGLMIGVKCRLPAADLLQAALQEHLLVVTAGDNVLRIIPPLVVNEDECLEAVARLARAAERASPRVGAPQPEMAVE